jgi:hypothetical protein
VEDLLLERGQLRFEGLHELALAVEFVAGDVGEDGEDPLDDPLFLRPVALDVGAVQVDSGPAGA